jgi:multimeric flavodoxin WrbA
MNHLYRYLNPTYFGNATEILRNVLKSSLRTCLAGNGPGFREFAYTMVSLPNSKGGFGVTDPCVLEQYAYISTYIAAYEE